MNQIQPRPTQDPVRAKLKALEDVLELYLAHKQRADELRDAARVITDIMAAEMTEELQECCWKLIRHLKDKEMSLRAMQETIANEKAAMIKAPPSSEAA